MLIADLKNNHSCHELSDLKRILKIRYGDGLNTFIMGNQDEPYPCLNLSVNGDLANVIYLSKGDHPGYQSIGINNGLDMNLTTMFCMGSVTELYAFSNKYVISFAQAFEVAIEFFETGRMPKCIEWFEL